MKTKDVDQIADAIVRKTSSMNQGQQLTAPSSLNHEPISNITIEKIENGYLVKAYDYREESGFQTQYIAQLDELPAIAKKIFE